MLRTVLAKDAFSIDGYQVDLETIKIYGKVHFFIYVHTHGSTA